MLAIRGMHLYSTNTKWLRNENYKENKKIIFIKTTTTQLRAILQSNAMGFHTKMSFCSPIKLKEVDLPSSCTAVPLLRE